MDTIGMTGVAGMRFRASAPFEPKTEDHSNVILTELDVPFVRYLSLLTRRISAITHDMHTHLKIGVA